MIDWQTDSWYQPWRERSVKYRNLAQSCESRQSWIQNSQAMVQWQLTLRGSRCQGEFHIGIKAGYRGKQIVGKIVLIGNIGQLQKRHTVWGLGQQQRVLEGSLNRVEYRGSSWSKEPYVPVQGTGDPEQLKIG